MKLSYVLSFNILFISTSSIFCMDEAIGTIEELTTFLNITSALKKRFEALPDFTKLNLDEVIYPYLTPIGNKKIENKKEQKSELKKLERAKNTNIACLKERQKTFVTLVGHHLINNTYVADSLKELLGRTKSREEKFIKKFEEEAEFYKKLEEQYSVKNKE